MTKQELVAKIVELTDEYIDGANKGRNTRDPDRAHRYLTTIRTMIAGEREK